VMCDAVITPSPFSATSRLVRKACGQNRPALRARGSFRWAQSYPWLYTQNATPVFPRSFKPVEAQRNLGGLDEAIADWLTRKKRQFPRCGLPMPGVLAVRYRISFS